MGKITASPTSKIIAALEGVSGLGTWYIATDTAYWFQMSEHYAARQMWGEGLTAGFVTNPYLIGIVNYNGIHQVVIDHNMKSLTAELRSKDGEVIALLDFPERE